MPAADARPFDLHGHVAVVTGANHGIGAATERALAAGGSSVLLTYLRLEMEPDPGIPDSYARERGSHADEVVGRIVADGGEAVGLEADLSDEGSHTLPFDVAEERFGPVDVVVNNASGWRADSFVPAPRDRLGRSLPAVQFRYSSSRSKHSRVRR